MNAAEPIRAGTIRDFDARFGPCGFAPDAWCCAFGLAENCLYVAGRSELPVIQTLDRTKLGVGDQALCDYTNAYTST